MKLQKRVLALEFEGDKAEIKYPTVLEMQNYAKEVEKVKDKTEKIIDIALNFLVKLGMPENWKTQLEQDHLDQILKALIGDKAKK